MQANDPWSESSVPAAEAALTAERTERRLLGRVIRVALGQLEDERTPDVAALMRFRDFVGGCADYLDAIVGLTETGVSEPTELAA